MNVIPLHRGPEARTVSAPDADATIDAYLDHMAGCIVRRAEAVRTLDGAS